MATIKTQDEYYAQFPKNGDPSVSDPSIAKERLKIAVESRRFEIDMYWRRATYFHTFLGAAFGAYGLLQSKEGVDNSVTFFVACLGFVISLAWYLVNRTSSFWHVTWDMQVFLLEEQVIGPLYKTTVNPKQLKF